MTGAASQLEALDRAAAARPGDKDFARYLDGQRKCIRRQHALSTRLRRRLADSKDLAELLPEGRPAKAEALVLLGEVAEGAETELHPDRVHAKLRRLAVLDLSVGLVAIRIAGPVGLVAAIFYLPLVAWRYVLSTLRGRE